MGFEELYFIEYSSLHNPLNMFLRYLPNIETDKCVATPIMFVIGIWVAKLETSHVLQSYKTKVIEGTVIAYQSL